MKKILILIIPILISCKAFKSNKNDCNENEKFREMFFRHIENIDNNIAVSQDSKFKEPIIAKIEKINVRTTQIETRDGNILVIPNAKLTQEYVENWSRGNPTTRFNIVVTVEYGTDTELVTKLLKQAAFSHPKIKKTEPVEVRLKDFGDNGLVLELFFWADQSWEASVYKSEIRFEIDRLFREYKITIPFPQRKVTITKD
jgi:small-conductance mechanosensitive channel